MTPIEIQAGAVERVQMALPATVVEKVTANAVEQVRLVVPTVVSIVIGG